MGERERGRTIKEKERGFGNKKKKNLYRGKDNSRSNSRDCCGV